MSRIVPSSVAEPHSISSFPRNCLRLNCATVGMGKRIYLGLKLHLLSPGRMLSAACQSVKFRFVSEFRFAFGCRANLSTHHSLSLSVKFLVTQTIAHAAGKPRKAKEFLDLAPRQIRDKRGHTLRWRMRMAQQRHADVNQLRPFRMPGDDRDGRAQAGLHRPAFSKAEPQLRKGLSRATRTTCSGPCRSGLPRCGTILAVASISFWPRGNWGTCARTRSSANRRSSPEEAGSRLIRTRSIRCKSRNMRMAIKRGVCGRAPRRAARDSWPATVFRLAISSRSIPGRSFRSSKSKTCVSSMHGFSIRASRTSFARRGKKGGDGLQWRACARRERLDDLQSP